MLVELLLAVSLIAAVLVTAGLTAFVRRYALTRSMIDVPNARSSHSVPTPRGGGIALVFVFLVLSSVMAPWFDFPVEALAALLVGGALVAVVGALDDHGHVGVGWRLASHGAAAAVAVVLIGGVPILQVGSWTVDPGPVGYLIAVLFIVWMLNLYNFMDGIDGIAAVELITVAGSAALLLAWQGEWGGAEWLLVLAACGVGFLFWNWPPAKIFMGDAGSGFVGFALAVFALWTSGSEAIGVWVWLILLGVFLVDASLTLLRRVMAGQQFYVAHRTHAYQYAARRIGSHRPVTVTVGVINVCWLLPVAALSVRLPSWGGVLLLLAWLPLVVLAWRLNAGVPEVD